MLGASISFATDAIPYKHEQWRDFASASGKFKILFPGTPRTSEQTRQTPTGTIVSRRFTLRAGPDITYDIMYSDYPGSIATRMNPKNIPDTARDGLVHQANGKLLRENTIAARGGIGREVEIKGADTAFYTVRFVLIGSRLYQALIVEGNPRRLAARPFLESFQILE